VAEFLTPSQRLDSLFPFKPMNPLDKGFKVNWLAQGLIMQGKINVLFGAEKAGKSRALAWMLAHMYSETTLWGIETKSPGKTLYLAGEEPRQEVTARLLAYQKAAGIPANAVDWKNILNFCEATGMRLDKPQQRQWLKDRLESGEYKTLLIDPLRRVHGASESSNDEMAPIANDLRDWTNRYNITLFLIHHTGKLSVDDDETRIATWSRGASDLPAVLDWALYARRMDGVGKGSKDKVKIIRKGRGPKEEDLVLLDNGDSFNVTK